MKLRALGTGSAFCRHPLVTSSFLIQSDDTNIVVGCGYNIPTKLEAVNLSASQVDMWLVLNTNFDQIAGLVEVAKTHKRKTAPYLVGPQAVLKKLESLYSLMTGEPLSQSFETRAVLKVGLNEEHFSDTISFVANYPESQGDPSYSLMFEKAQIFISGDTTVNEEFLHRYGAPAELVLHSCTLDPLNKRSGRPSIDELQTLPLYLQKKIWLYGYENSYLDHEEPFPMLFIPQGTWVFDSGRKDTHLDKERFIKESARRHLGNQSSIEKQKAPRSAM